MHMLLVRLVMLVLGLLLFLQAPIPGDADRGARLFDSQRCVVCHAIQGRGGQLAPDLGKSTGRALTPSLLASLVWNHGPRMWSSFEGLGIAKPQLSEQQAADLFAYFYAFRYFEKPGDAARGRQVFLNLSCARCHSPSGAAGPQGAPPVSKWTSLGSPLLLAGALWNHASAMETAMKERGIRWPVIDAQKLTDLLVYLRNLPGSPTVEAGFTVGAPEPGEALFRSKGCATCHKGSLDLSTRGGGRTPTDFAAAMWNHAPLMFYKTPPLAAGEMRELAGYLWSLQYFEEKGDARRGAKVYARKQCDSCHADASWFAPSLSKRAQPLNSIAVVSALWRHGPAMLARMEERGMKWPRFKDEEMADLIAYVNSLR
ncbi:MAG: c-type cytochrome [Bryobacteraceae bacterium]